MKIDTRRLVSMTEANQNFSRVARLVNENGSAVILKNNHPRYLVLDFQKLDAELEQEDLPKLALDLGYRHVRFPNGDAKVVVGWNNLIQQYIESNTNAVVPTL